MPWLRSVAGLWGVAGFSLLLVMAIHRLLPHAIDGLSMPLDYRHLVLLVANIVFMAYSEGYRGFQRSFSPRFARRVVEIRQGANSLQGILAPFYCMGYFGSSRRQKITAWVLTGLIVGLVVTFHYIPQPWRGVLDLGVVVGLVYGLIATWMWTIVLWNAPDNEKEADQLHTSQP